MAALDTSFGYYPQPLSIRAGAVSIDTLPGFEEIVRKLESNAGIDDDWIYPPLLGDHPYPSRVFGLPKTHRIAHEMADNTDHLEFHVWSLSFFTGTRLSTTERGFLDSTPIRPGKLVDFVLRSGLEFTVALAEEFWRTHLTSPERARLVEAAIHALFLAQRAQNLQFERFLLLYTALDACYALSKSVYAPPCKLRHGERITWMCSLFQMPVPDWANPTTKTSSPVANIRNAAIHEALVRGEPLGFALLSSEPNQILPLEMEALTCRLLVALLGARTDYVCTPVNTQQRYGLALT